MNHIGFNFSQYNSYKDVIAPHPSPVKKRATPPPVNATDSTGARKSVSNSAPTSRSSSFKKQTEDLPPVSPSGAKGTWFGTSKSLARANPQSAEGIGEMFKEEIKKEDEALEMLDNVLMSEQEKEKRAESKDAYSAGKPTKPVQRGAARESYRNATAEEKPVIHTSTERSVKEEDQETLQYEKKVSTKSEMKKKTELTHEEVTHFFINEKIAMFFGVNSRCINLYFSFLIMSNIFRS